MIKVTVFYPNTPGKRFDVDYYANKHMPLAQSVLGVACKGTAVEKGLSGGAPGVPAPSIALGHLYFDTVETFQASSHRPEQSAPRSATRGLTLATAQRRPAPLSRASTTVLLALSTLPLPSGKRAARKAA